MTLLLTPVFLAPRDLVYDNFNRGDNSSLGRAETGQAYNNYGGALQIISGRCVWTSSGVDMANWLVDSGRPDGHLQARMMSNGSYVEMIFRGVNVNNWLIIGINVGIAGADMEVWKQVAGVYTRIGTGGGDMTAGQFYIIDCIYRGSNIKVYRDGVLIFDITETDNQTGTLVGPRMRAATEAIDWYEVKAV